MKELSIEETKEIWKQIEEEDFNSYSVSNLGRIKNRKGKILKPQLICGYLYCILRRKNGKNTSRRINRLVALAFCDGYKDGYVANHIDHDRLNNRADNLEWCDQKYNSNYGTNGQRISSKLTNGLRSKVVEQYDRKGNFIKEFPSVAEVSRLLGFPTSSITRCCNGSKKYSVVGGYQWKYKGSDKQILNLPTINKYSQDGTLICSYNSVNEASQDTGVHRSSISQCFTGKKKSAGGFIWKKEL